jgi:teichuronic acid biosynthesis protein TuaE
MKENNKSIENIIFAAYIILAAALNVLTNRNSIVIDLFALFYGLLIIKVFNNDSFEDKIYFSTLLFSVLSFTFLIKIKGKYDLYFYYVSTFLYLLHMLKNYKKYDIRKLIKNKYSIFLIIFVVYMIASIAWSADKYLAVKTFVNYCIMLSLLIVVIDYNIKPGIIVKTIKYIFYMLPAIVLIGLVEITGNRFNIRNHYFDENLYRLAPGFLKKIPATIFYNPNNYGVFLVLAMAFLFIAIIYTQKRWLKVVSGIL